MIWRAIERRASYFLSDLDSKCYCTVPNILYNETRITIDEVSSFPDIYSHKSHILQDYRGQGDLLGFNEQRRGCVEKLPEQLIDPGRSV